MFDCDELTDEAETLLFLKELVMEICNSIDLIAEVT
ncbi:hypothetical protein XF_2026 [Xylella fastidiosa 9a5c]|uniref:Uncharacterized protein n=1 Tax=Xylella fastidiosa (strain 9a5c) TaxID=160492 RepID=Q9PBV9_XYLFA|nr:hypothetical protein XF_2026 [Xylella fastidiosa 9a5c]